MAWGDLASNQMVSFTDAQSSPFSLNSGESPVTSNQCMDKTAALTKYNLSSSAMSAYASNQLVPKSVWETGLIASCVNFDINGYFPDGQNYINFQITFVNAPLINTNFTISIIGLTSGFQSTKVLNTSDLNLLSGTSWLGNTDPAIGSGYIYPEAGFTVSFSPFSDGTYYHDECSVIINN